MGDFHTIHYPMEIFPTRKTFLYRKSPPPFSLWEIPCFFIPKTLWGIPTFFSMGNPHHFTNSPMGNSQKKSGKNFFLRDIWTTVSPKMGVPPGERGHGGIPTPPPMGYMGGGDCLSRLLVKITCSGTCSGTTCSVRF